MTQKIEPKAEREWVSGEIEILFDVATADAMEKIPNQEDKDFLLAQREPARRGKIGGIDHKQAAMEKRMVKHKMAQRAYETKSQKETLALSTVSDNADI